MSCLERHYDNIKVLSISKNRIGIDGVMCIAKAIGSLKSLSVLDLSFNEIGDAGILELITKMVYQDPEAQVVAQKPSLEELNLSGNDIGKN